MGFNDSFGDRMKAYEGTSQNELLRRTPVIIRLDGKSFHTYTKNFERPFDTVLHTAMVAATAELVASIQGCVVGYTQSDEISLLLRDWDKLETDCWYGYNVQKLVSVSASICTYAFNKAIYNTGIYVNMPPAYFDSRAYNIPKEEVCNYFVWRQQDASRNSINSLAQSLYSQKQLNGKKVSDVHDMLMLEKGINWNDLDTWKKRGSCAYRQADGGTRCDPNIPIFTQDRMYIDKFLSVETTECGNE